MEKLITLQQASVMLGVSKITLRRWDNSGKFKALRTIGGARRYSEDDINKLLNNMRQNEKIND
jgi:excisionase family DNA binding protein